MSIYTRNCNYCKKLYTNQGRQFCSKSCRAKAINVHTSEWSAKISQLFQGAGNPFFGKKHSEDTRRKMSEAKNGSKNHNFGKHRSEETKKKIKLANRGRHFPLRSGEKSRFWKGGITSLTRQIRRSPEYIIWRESIFKRDNYTCLFCKTHCTALHAHHIKFFSEIIAEYKIKSIKDAYACKKLWDINNGMTLCILCHKMLHKCLKQREKNRSSAKLESYGSK